MSASDSGTGSRDLTSLGLGEQQTLLADRKVSAAELAEAHFRVIEENRNLNVFITEMRDEAMTRAKASDQRIAAGNALPLDGIAIAVKDNYCTKGVRTTAGSNILGNFVPNYESTVTQKLLDAGAVIVGKTNMDEFAMGSSTESSHFGPTVNPAGVRAGLENIAPGGSSGGSAAAVAANMAAGALGSDTGGSIRQPAGFCGVVGFKPTYGVCSRWGIVAYGSSLDQAGVFTRSVADAATLMDVISGEDKKDTTSYPRDDYGFATALSEPAGKLKIGFAKEIIEAGSTADTEKVWAAARALADKIGAEIVDVSIPSFNYSLPAYYIIALSEASSNLARYDGVRYGYRATGAKDIIDMYEKSRAEGFGAEVKRRIMLGTFALSAGYYDAYYLKAQKVRKKVQGEFEAAFKQCDVLFMPATPTAAFPIGSHSGDPVEMYLEDVFTVPVNMAGLPAITIPAATSANGLPLGLQIVGPQFADTLVMRAAMAAETAVPEL